MAIHSGYVETPVGMAVSPQFPHGKCGQWRERAVGVHCKDHVYPHFRRGLRGGGGGIDWLILVVRNWGPPGAGAGVRSEIRDQRFGYKCWMAAGNEERRRLFRQVLEMISSVRTMPWMKQEDGCTSQGEGLDI